MGEKGDQLRTELLETILAYFEGKKSFEFVLTLGKTLKNRKGCLMTMTPSITKAISLLNQINNKIERGKNFSREEINEIFTDILEILID